MTLATQPDESHFRQNGSNSQLDATGRLRHLLTLEGLPPEAYEDLFERAAAFVDEATGRVRRSDLLAGRLVANVFFEPSTRTRLAFEIAARFLGADVVNLDVPTSSSAKGESFEDTLRTVTALGAEILVVRHGGRMRLGDEACLGLGAALVSGGEGTSGHPSQALLDAWTIRREKGTVEGLRVAVIGDIVHSRVARSLAQALNALGAGEVVVSGPERLVPKELGPRWGVTVEHDPNAAVAGADVIIALRFQYERMDDSARSATGGGAHSYLLDERRVALASPGAMVMHPGPINRGVEITDAVADSDRSFILRQVTNGVAMRMAILSAVVGA